MLTFDIAFAIVPGLILFLYGIENFSREIQNIAGEKFRSLLGKATNHPLKGAILGAGVTSIIQSSTATTVIVVGLVGSGVIPFTQSLGVIIGANVGSTVTAQLVAFKLTYLAPIFIFLGFLISLLGRKYSFLGKPIFYFGLVFFSLNLISAAIEPLKEDPEVIGLFAQFSNILIAIAGGFLFTLVVQSSSVTTGIVVVLVGAGLLSLEQGIPIIMGSNIGTTITSYFASINLDVFAKRAAAAHFIFNFGGVLIFLPFISGFADFVVGFGGSPAQQMANAHLLFNLISAAIFLIAIPEFENAIKRIVPGKQKEIIFRPKYLNEELPQSNLDAINLISNELRHSLEITSELYSSSMKILHGSSDVATVTKLETFNDYLDDQISDRIFELSKRELTMAEAKKIVLLVRMSNSIEQLGDIAESIAYVSLRLRGSGSSLSEPAIESIDSAFSKFEETLSIISKSVPSVGRKEKETIKRNDAELGDIITQSYKDHLRRLYTQKAYAGTTFVRLIHMIESANSVAGNIRQFSETYSKL
ncbi:Na/Pi cotransporter family protein [Candidatus Micrarchaeota archaeon]|nr:Na/Pi cotransporter family protein [Candidatus Micrarchaeota archaeon]